jgi:hypothetical protein
MIKVFFLRKVRIYFYFYYHIIFVVRVYWRFTKVLTIYLCQTNPLPHRNDKLNTVSHFICLWRIIHCFVVSRVLYKWIWEFIILLFIPFSSLYLHPAQFGWDSWYAESRTWILLNVDWNDRSWDFSKTLGIFSMTCNIACTFVPDSSICCPRDTTRT